MTGFTEGCTRDAGQGDGSRRERFGPNAEQLGLLRRLNREIVCHSQVEKALAFLQEALDYASTGLEGEIYVMTGVPRVGKTAAVGAFRVIHGPLLVDGSVVRHVLFVSITENNRSQSIYALIADALGLVVPSAIRNARGGNERFIALVFNELRCQKVSLIVIDEAQKLALGGSDYRISEMNEALKVQTNANVCSIALVGTPELAQLFELQGTSLAAVTSKQLQGRLLGQHVFEAFTTEEASMTEYVSILEHLDGLVSGKGKRFGFAKHARLTLHLTEGRMGETNKLLNRLIRDSWRTGVCAVSRDVIIAAQARRVGASQVKSSLVQHMEAEAVEALVSPGTETIAHGPGRTTLHGKRSAPQPDFRR